MYLTHGQRTAGQQGDIPPSLDGQHIHPDFKIIVASPRLANLGVHIHQQCAGNDVVGHIIGHFRHPTCGRFQRHPASTCIDAVQGDALGGLDVHLAFSFADAGARALGHHNRGPLCLQKRACARFNVQSAAAVLNERACALLDIALRQQRDRALAHGEVTVQIQITTHRLQAHQGVGVAGDGQIGIHMEMAHSADQHARLTVKKQLVEGQIVHIGDRDNAVQAGMGGGLQGVGINL